MHSVVEQHIIAYRGCKSNTSHSMRSVFAACQINTYVCLSIEANISESLCLDNVDGP